LVSEVADGDFSAPFALCVHNETAVLLLPSLGDGRRKAKRPGRWTGPFRSKGA
jgi:hypothetical protein